MSRRRRWASAADSRRLERRHLGREAGVVLGELAGRAEVVAGALPLPGRGDGRGESGIPLVEESDEVLVGVDRGVSQPALEVGVLLEDGLDGVAHGVLLSSVWRRRAAGEGPEEGLGTANADPRRPKSWRAGVRETYLAAFLP